MVVKQNLVIISLSEMIKLLYTYLNMKQKKKNKHKFLKPSRKVYLKKKMEEKDVSKNVNVFYQ